MTDTTAVRIFNAIEKAQYVLNYCFNELKGDDVEKVKAAIKITLIYTMAVVGDCSKLQQKKYPATDVLIQEFLINPNKAETLSVGISNMFSDFHADIVSFVGTNPWILHSVELRNDTLYVIKSADYRIVAWDELRKQLKELKVQQEKALSENDLDAVVSLKAVEENIIRQWMLL